MRINVKFTDSSQEFQTQFRDAVIIKDGYTQEELDQAVSNATKAGLEQGKQAEYDRLVDPTKIIEKTVSGTVIRVDDVSEIPHRCTVSVDKDASVSVYGKNLLPYPFHQTTLTLSGITFTDNGDGSLTLNGTATASSAFILNANHLFGDTTINAMNSIGGATNGTYTISHRLYYNAGNGILSININAGASFDNETIYPQVELGTASTAWEQYQKATHTISAWQNFEVDSICPTMTLLADNDATITFGYHKSYGAQTEYDRFWDAYLQNGNITNTAHLFGGEGWNDTIFKPKYSINANSAYMLFRFSEITDIGQALKECGVTITITDSILQYSFHGVMTKTIDNIIFVNPVKTMIGAFASATSLQRISCVIPVEDANISADSFSWCIALEEIRFSGTIASNLNLAHSSELSNESVQSIIDVLKDLTGATAQTLTFHATVGGNLTQVHKDAVTAKNWTLVY